MATETLAFTVQKLEQSVQEHFIKYNGPNTHAHDRTLKSKNLIILCVWTALSAIFLVWSVVGAGYSNNPTQWLLWIESTFLIYFVITLIFTGAVAFFMPENISINSR